MPPGSVSLQTSNPSSVLLEGGQSRVGLRRQSGPIARTNPVNGDLLPTNAVEARNNGRFQVQSNTNWFTSKLTAAAVLPYAVVKGVLIAVDYLMLTLPSSLIGAVSNRGLQPADRTDFQVQVPGAAAGQAATGLKLDGMVLPKLVPRGLDATEMREQVQAKIYRGHDILEGVRNGTRSAEQPATKKDVSDIAFYLQARGQLANEGTAFSSGAFTIPDPECRIRNFLDSSPDAYQRDSSHTSKFQALDGARHRGIDLPEGGGSSLDEAMPYGMETLLYGSLPKNEGMRMPEDRLFLKMESHGAWLSKPSPGYEPDGPRRTAKLHDVGAFVGHSCSFLATRGKGSAAGSRKERIPDFFKREFRQLLKDAPNAKTMLLKDSPMDSSMGIRVAYRNAQDALLQTWNQRPAERKALQGFITNIEQRFTHPDVRIGNEIILENHASGASLGDALESLASEHPNQRLVLGGLMQFATQNEQAWAEHTVDRPTDRYDAGAQQRFVAGRMERELARFDNEKAKQVLQNLEGAFGDRTKAMCDFAVEQLSVTVDQIKSPEPTVSVGLSGEVVLSVTDEYEYENSPEAVLLSRLTRMNGQVGSLVDQLKSRLSLPVTEHLAPASIDSADQLRPLELAALAHIGVEAKYEQPNSRHPSSGEIVYQTLEDPDVEVLDGLT